jgi:hypothetical protein
MIIDYIWYKIVKGVPGWFVFGLLVAACLVFFFGIRNPIAVIAISSIAALLVRIAS